MKTSPRYDTRSQRIAELCELRKECIQRRARALLRGDTEHIQTCTNAIAFYTQLIREQHQPPYLKRKPKP